jgi:hypothetical protein
MKATVTRTFEIDITAKEAAEWFCGVSDEDQAQFLIEVERISREWHPNADGQWWYMCGHLQECGCSNEETREMVRTWAHYLDPRDPPPIEPSPMLGVEF